MTAVLNKDEIAVSFNVGGISNYGGGVLLKFVLANGEHRVLIFPRAFALGLQDGLIAYVARPGRTDLRDAPAEQLASLPMHHPFVLFAPNKPKVVPEDYDAGVEAVVESWRGEEWKDAILINYLTASGSSGRIAIAESLSFVLQDFVSTVINKLGLTPDNRSVH